MQIREFIHTQHTQYDAQPKAKRAVAVHSVDQLSYPRK